MVFKTAAVVCFTIHILSRNSLEGMTKTTKLPNNITAFHAVKVELDLSTTEPEAKKDRHQFRYRHTR
jgi:hypothetical protein